MNFKAEHTVSRILKFAFLGVILSLVLLWFIGGGVQKIIEKARTFQFGSLSGGIVPSGSFADFRLPWQFEAPTLDIQGVSGGVSGDGSYDTSGLPPGSGIPSPYAGDVSIREAAARAQSATGQYIELQSRSGETINISGWSVEGLSGARAYIPEGTSLFVMGRVNTVGAIALVPGGSAIVSTGASPVGVSFQENKCTGYLGTLQPFVPALESACPSPTTAIPRTAENEMRLGASCFQYLSQLAPCTFPQNPPATLSPACRSEIQTKLSYNGCVNQNRNSSGFASGSWRVYLARGNPLWNVEHDIIRLLDGEGKVVNVLHY
ncbi:lamin tail domain-containing protein [Candidatus Parcubacteria bacterium]|nr:MAG: lamin tail domain-containing protein [Candidatus Parcubacteria bacterium]